MPIKFIDSVEALGLQLVPSSTESDTSSDSSTSSPSSTASDDSTTADLPHMRRTAHEANANIDPADLPFDPTKANDDVEVFKQYFKYVLDTATDTPCSWNGKNDGYGGRSKAVPRKYVTAAKTHCCAVQVPESLRSILCSSPNMAQGVLSSQRRC